MSENNENLKNLVMLGYILTVLGILGIKSIWIISILNPVVHIVSTPVVVGAETSSEEIYVGLQAFLMNHDITGLFIVCCSLGVIGLLIVLHPFIKAAFKSNNLIAEEVEKLKDELMKDIMQNEMENIKDTIIKTKE